MASSETNDQSAREMQTAVVPVVGNIYLYENYSGSRKLRIGTFCEVVWVRVTLRQFSNEITSNDFFMLHTCHEKVPDFFWGQ